MNCKKNYFILLLIVAIHNQVISKPINFKSNSDNSKIWDKHGFQFGFTFGALKYSQVGINLQYNYSPVSWFSVGGGVDLLNHQQVITSASDDHELTLGILPVYAVSNFLLRNNEKKFKVSYYGYSKYGIGFGLPEEASYSAKSNPFLEYGVGLMSLTDNSHVFSQKVNYRLEIGRQHHKLVGMFESSYNSKINYDFHFSSYLLRLAMVF